MSDFSKETPVPLNYEGAIHEWNNGKSKIHNLNFDKILVNKLNWDEDADDEVFYTVVPTKNCDCEQGLFFSLEAVNKLSIRLFFRRSGIGDFPSLGVNLLPKIIKSVDWEKAWVKGSSGRIIKVFQTRDYKENLNKKKIDGILVTTEKVKF